MCGFSNKWTYTRGSQNSWSSSHYFFFRWVRSRIIRLISSERLKACLLKGYRCSSSEDRSFASLRVKKKSKQRKREKKKKKPIMVHRCHTTDKKKRVNICGLQAFTVNHVGRVCQNLPLQKVTFGNHIDWVIRFQMKISCWTSNNLLPCRGSRNCNIYQFWRMKFQFNWKN